MNVQMIIQELAEAGLLDASRTEVRPLTGGVSSDIRLLDDGRRRLVVKQALPQLRVAAEWRADVGRNAVEHRYLECVGGLMPGAVPAVRYVSNVNNFFAMDYLDDRFQTWKHRLFAGEVDPQTAEMAGALLGTIHRATWADDEVCAAFDTTSWFDQLRIDPYLRATASAHPPLRAIFEAEAARIAASRLCLVHGDYSPKNLLVGPGTVVVIDCEVAWFGDPTFDVAFLLNHLLLKALHLREHRAEMIDLAYVAWNAYTQRLGDEQAEVVRRNLSRLLLILMLARIDGKSPVEYITADAQKQRIRRFVTRQLTDAPTEPDSLFREWFDELKQA